MDAYIQSSKKSQLDFEVFFEHTHRDQQSIMILLDINRRPITNEEDEEYDYDVKVPFEPAVCAGYEYKMINHLIDTIIYYN